MHDAKEPRGDWLDQPKCTGKEGHEARPEALGKQGLTT